MDDMFAKAKAVKKMGKCGTGYVGDGIQHASALATFTIVVGAVVIDTVSTGGLPYV